MCNLEKKSSLKKKHFTEYKILKNKFPHKEKKRNILMKRSKTKYPSCIWKSLKVIQNNGEQVSISCIPKSLSLKGETIQDKQDIVNSFNEHCVNISNLISRPRFNSESFSHLKQHFSIEG